VFLHKLMASLGGVLVAQGGVDGRADLVESEGEGLGQRGAPEVDGVAGEGLRKGGGELIDGECGPLGHGTGAGSQEARSVVSVDSTGDLLHASDDERGPSVLRETGSGFLFLLRLLLHSAHHLQLGDCEVLGGDLIVLRSRLQSDQHSVLTRGISSRRARELHDNLPAADVRRC